MSGPWRGWWRRGLQEGHEALSLTIAGGVLRGSGQDQEGTFALEGRVDADGNASLTKRYTLPLIVTPPRLAYQGRWNGRVIRGTWVDETTRQGKGPFLLWPSQE
jgi:hypothetical protein